MPQQYAIYSNKVKMHKRNFLSRFVASRLFRQSANTMSPLLLAVIVLLIGYLLWSRRHLYHLSWKFRGRLGYPLIGSFFDHLNVTDFGEYFKNTIWANYESPCVVWLGGTVHVAVKDVEYVQLILTSTDIMDKHSLYELFHPVGGKNSLNFSTNAMWKHQRRIFNPSLNLINTNKFIPSFNMAFDKYVNHHLKHAVNKGTVDLYEDFIHTVFALSFETIAGKSLDWIEKTGKISMHDCLKISQDNIDDRTTKVYLHSDFIYQFTKSYKEITTVMGKMHDVLQSLVFDNPSTEFLEVTRPGDAIIDVIRKNSDKPAFGAEDGRFQILNLLTASFETAGFTIYMAMFYMARHPEFQDKLYEELRLLFPDKNFKIDVDTLSHLVYTEMVMNEVMRLHPPIPMIGRRCTKDTVLRNGIFIPKGVEFLIDLVNLHRNEKYWGPDADSFNPDNFRPEKRETRPANAFIPFSIGTRNCIGSRYAKNAVKIAIAKIFRSYRLETPHTLADMKYKRGTAMQIITPVLFKVFERSD